MTEQEKFHFDFLNELFEHWDNIRLLRKGLVHSLLSDIVDAAIKDIEAGKLEKDSHIIEYIRWLNEEILEGLNDENKHEQPA